MRASAALSRAQAHCFHPRRCLSAPTSSLLLSFSAALPRPDPDLIFRYSRLLPRPAHSYNTLISQLSRAGLARECLALFTAMRASHIPVDEFALPAVLRSSAALGLAGTFKSVHALSMRLGLAKNLHVASALVLFYCNLREISCARRLFDEMTHRDAVLWTSMLSGYAQSGEPESAFRIFNEMVAEGVYLDGVVMVSLLLACGQLGWLRQGKSIHGFGLRACLGLPLTMGNALIDMYVKCGAFGSAERVFRGMAKRDVISWTALILGHGLNGRAEVALRLFEQMRAEGIVPNSVTYLGVLSACGHAGMVEKVWNFFDLMKACGVKPELKHYACVVDALGRAGQLEEAEKFVEDMPVEPDEAILGALLAGCRVHAKFEVGKRVSRRLLKMHPDKGGYYMGLANLYSDAGRFDDAERVRTLMKKIKVCKVIGRSSIEFDGSSQL